MSSSPLASSDSPVRSAHRGMRTIDMSGNERLAILMQTIGAVSRATDPDEVVDVFSNGMVQLNGRRGLVAINTRGLALGEYRITRLTHDDNTRVIESRAAWSDGGDAPVHASGFFSHLVRSAYPELIHDFYLRDDPVVGDTLSRYGSMMAVPIFDEGEPRNWAIFLHPDADGFDPEDMENAVLRSNVIGRAARNVQIADELRTAHGMIRAEVQQIASIQRALLPDKLPTIPGVELAASYQVFDQAGGDLYDFVPIGNCGNVAAESDDPTWMLLIADASGHGPAAAVVTAMVHAILHAFPKQPCGSAEILQHVNAHLAAKRIESSFVTAFLGIFDPLTRELTYSRAGHDPPLLKAGDASVTRLDDIGGIPLGILSDTTYEQKTITLQRGTTLVLYTDGITEARAPQGEMFGVAGMENAFASCTGDATCTVQSITDALAAHEAGRRPSDDQTLIAMQIT